MSGAVASLAALAHAHRLAVFRLLVKAGSQGATAGEIAAALSLPPSSLSYHLAALESAGMVASNRAGRFIHYRVVPDAIRELLAYLTEDCCEGRPELCSGRNAHERRSARPRAGKRRTTA